MAARWRARENRLEPGGGAVQYSNRHRGAGRSGPEKQIQTRRAAGRTAGMDGGGKSSSTDPKVKLMRKATLLYCTLAFGTLHAQNHLTTTATERYFNVVRRNLEASADAMPADKYAFKLTDGQMSFAQWLIHSAQRNYSDCAALKSESVPAAEKQAASLKEKAEVSKALKDSFAYCADALQNMTDQKATSSAQVSNAF